MGNRERILAESQRLMNERGAQAIGTTQIAEALQISPGNLYYHFKNKEEIVRTLFDDLEADFRDTLTEDVGPPIGPTRFAGFYLRALNVMWSYRFFFGGTLHLLRQDEELARRYRELQAWGVDTLEGIARQLVKDGVMDKLKGAKGLRSVATNTWLIWSNWVRFVQISSPDQSIGREEMVAGVAQILDVLTPYLKPDFERAARRVLAAELKKQPT